MKSHPTPYAALVLASGILLPTARAELRPPYTADAHTVHLYHFDEVAGGSATANAGSAAGSAYTMDVNPVAGAVVTSVLGGSAYSGFTRAANFAGTLDHLAGFDHNGNGAYQTDQSGTVLSPDAVNLGSLGIGGGSPFTLEAMVNTNSATGNRFILSTDSSATNRGFQFRITTGGGTGQRLEFNQITNGGQRFGEIPNSGPHAFATGQWFHAAFVHDGTNCRFYWTKIDPATTAVNPLGTPQALALNAAVAGYTGPLVIGGEQRGVAGEGINGLIDEVRISKIARGPSYFLFLHDTDADGLDDNWELGFAAGLGELSGLADADADLDGVSDLAEYNGRSDPKNLLSTPDDLDADSLPDAWETSTFGNTAAQSGGGDPDNDHATNSQEYAALSLPLDKTSFPDEEDGIGDGMCDPWEIAQLGGTTALPGADADADGATNLAEFLANSDPDDATWTPTRAKLRHRWSFNGDLVDSVGGSDAQLIDPDSNPLAGGNATLSASDLLLDGGDHATSAHARLGGNLLQGLKTPVTLEFWATQIGERNWSRIFDFGSGTGEHLFMSWTQGTNIASDRVSWTDLVASTVDNSNQPYSTGSEFHLVMTIRPGAGSASGTLVEWYSSNSGNADLGALQGSFTTTNQLATFNDAVNNLGRSQFPGDNTANARYNEVRIWNGALSPTELEFHHDAGPAGADDSDADGLPDAWEVLHFRANESETPGEILAKHGGSSDPDLDLGDNLAEFAAGSDPADTFSSPDSDLDGLADGYEVFWFRATPEESLADILVKHSATSDADNDGFANGAERDAATSPVNPTFTPLDSDGDGLVDSWEQFHFASLAQSGNGDPDLDSADNLAEQNAGSNPTLPASVPTDTDGDGTPDAAGFFQPYAVDADTLHLWHLDEVKAPAANAVAGGIPLTSLANGALLWTPSLPAFGTALDPSANRGTLNAGVLSALPLANDSSDDSALPYQGAEGAFTFEALVRIGFDPLAAPASTAEMHLLSGESENGANRVWQFRIVPIGGPGNVGGSAPRLEFINIRGEVAVQSLSAPLPLGTDPNAIAQGSWYHVAVAYDGNEATAGNLKLYWTLMDPARGRAAELFSGQLAQDLIAAAPDFTIGNEGRDFGSGAGTTGNLLGVIDEVRISSVARTPEEFHFASSETADQLDDDWELFHFGNLDQTDGGDFDADGTDNLAEYRLGLVPTSGSSRFAATLGAAGQLQWPGAAGVSFKIERSTTLAGDWLVLDAAFPGSAGGNSFTDPSPPAGKAFYKVTLNP
jgi:hypothetical protein